MIPIWAHLLALVPPMTEALSVSIFRVPEFALSVVIWQLAVWVPTVVLMRFVSPRAGIKEGERRLSIAVGLAGGIIGSLAVSELTLVRDLRQLEPVLPIAIVWFLVGFVLGWCATRLWFWVKAGMDAER